MLEALQLPPALWGEAILTATYLWNHMESTSLPPGTTPFEVINGHPPDLSHLCMFGSYYWARISTELQSKFGHHSCHVFFMKYPDGVKEYCIWDYTTGFILHGLQC